MPSFRTGAAPGGVHLTLSAYLLPLWICLAVSLIALLVLPMSLVRDRERGWLRRISTTPAPPSWLLIAHTMVNAALAVLALAVLTLGDIAFFGVHAPANPGGYLLAALLLTTSMLAVGLLLAAVAPTSRAAAGLGNLVLYPLLFLGGLWVSRENMAPVLRTIGDYTPLSAASQAMRSAMLGAFPSAANLLVLLGWTAAFGLAAVRLFRWE